MVRLFQSPSCGGGIPTPRLLPLIRKELIVSIAFMRRRDSYGAGVYLGEPNDTEVSIAFMRRRDSYW